MSTGMKPFWYDNNFFKDKEDVVMRYHNAESTQETGNKFLLGGALKPVTKEQVDRASNLGMNKEAIERLLKAGTDHDVNNEPERLEHVEEDRYIIKPDPRGVYYFKATVNGKIVIKPLSDDFKKSKVLRDKYLQEYKLS